MQSSLHASHLQPRLKVLRGSTGSCVSRRRMRCDAANAHSGGSNLLREPPAFHLGDVEAVVLPGTLSSTHASAILVHSTICMCKHTRIFLQNSFLQKCWFPACSYKQKTNISASVEQVLRRNSFDWMLEKSLNLALFPDHGGRFTSHRKTDLPQASSTVANKTGKGRGLAATKALLPGDEILSCMPLVSINNSDGIPEIPNVQELLDRWGVLFFLCQVSQCLPLYSYRYCCCNACLFMPLSTAIAMSASLYL